MSMTINQWDAHHICEGRSLIRISQGDLADDPELWASVWAESREQLLPDWIGRNPGTRPAAWWVHDADTPRFEGETEAEYLHRLGLLGDDELAGIRRKALALIGHDRGRDPRRPSDNFIPASAEIRLLAQIGLLTAEERAILHL